MGYAQCWLTAWHHCVTKLEYWLLQCLLHAICCVPAELKHWLACVGLPGIQAVTSLEAAFADGRLLCKLVELLQRISLAGVEWRRPAMGAAHHNVSKVKSMLPQAAYLCPYFASVAGISW